MKEKKKKRDNHGPRLIRGIRDARDFCVVQIACVEARSTFKIANLEARSNARAFFVRGNDRAENRDRLFRNRDYVNVGRAFPGTTSARALLLPLPSPHRLLPRTSEQTFTIQIPRIFERFRALPRTFEADDDDDDDDYGWTAKVALFCAHRCV